MLLSVSCAPLPKPAADSCAGFEEIRPSEGVIVRNSERWETLKTEERLAELLTRPVDVLTPNTAGEIVAHNRVYARNCDQQDTTQP